MEEGDQEPRNVQTATTNCKRQGNASYGEPTEKNAVLPVS